MSRTTKSPLAMARAALAAAEQVVPPYSCKHSRKDFTQPQLLALLLLKQFFQIGYRDVVAWVAEWSDLREALGLTKVPHFTAIQKAGARLLKKESLESLLDATIALARERGLISDASELAAIDSTGLETRHVSTYYGQRSGRKYHRFPKLSAVVDVHSHLCLAAVIDRGPKPDDAEFRPAVRQARRRHRFRGLLGDAGYDSERNHRYLDRYCSVLGIIPPRRGRPHRHRHRLPGGFYRRFWAEYWPAHWYGQRWQVETHFSMHKRLLGSALRARRRRAQDQEIFLRVLALNLMIACWAFWRFLQSSSRSISPIGTTRCLKAPRPTTVTSLRFAQSRCRLRRTLGRGVECYYVTDLFCGWFMLHFPRTYTRQLELAWLKAALRTR